MKKLFLCFSFLCFFILSAYCQTTLTGTVRNKQGEPLTVTVTVQVKGSKTISGFTASNAEGKYSVTYKGTGDSIVIAVSGIAIGKHYCTVPNRSGTVDFDIEEKAMVLKEVTITAVPIRRVGDTLNYNVNSYVTQNDRNIEDVIKKMPGIDVNASGTISYNGKNISKFYVENLDLLQGRYGIATKNISPKDVAVVQVLENHQPIKALRDKLPSDAAAINLKLKDSAKGTLALTALAGAGYKPAIWNAELVAMYFASGKQNMSTYKGNNSGRDAAMELQSHYDYDRVGVGNASMLSITSPSTPPVNKKRYLNNVSNSISVNHLFKIKEELNLTANATYYNERIEKEGYSLSEQFMPDNSSLRIEEQVKSTTRANNLELDLRLNTNTFARFIKNSLIFRGGWNKDRGTGITRSNVGDMDEALLQHLDRPSFTVNNTFDMMQNIGSKMYKIFFLVSYSHRPHTLSVTPVDYFGDNTLASLEQSVVSKDFTSQIRGSFGLKLGKINADYSLWSSADIRGMDTELTGTDKSSRFVPAADSLINDLGYNTWQVGINQNYTYERRKFQTALSLPITNYTLVVNDRIPDNSTTNNRWIINPSLSATYNLTTELSASAGANFRKAYGNMNDVYTGYIMHSYRSMLRNTCDRLFESRSGGANASLLYRDAIRALFVNVGINYSKSWRNLLYGYNYQGIMQIKTTIDQPTKSENYTVNFSASKGLNFWRSTLRLSGGYSESRSEQLVQEEILDYRYENYVAGAFITVNPVSFMNLEYGFSWMQSQSFVKKLTERFPSIRNHTHTAKVWIFPSKSISVNISGDYRYNSSVGKRNSTFADALIRYKHRQTEWEMEFSNLFNVRKYVSASYSDISTYYYSYDLRPRSFLLKVRFRLK